MQPLFYAHSGLRYLVLLAGIAAVGYLAWAVVARRPGGRPARVLTAAFAGLLDLQILLGVGLAASGIFYPALSGHIVMMLLAAGAAHGGSVLGRRSDPARADRARLLGVALALLLIAGGILSIGRALFGTGVPSVTH